MNPPPLNPLIVPGKEDESPAHRLQRIVRKSALLNVVIVLTAFPVLVYAGGPNAVVPVLKIMAGISALIWAATFALFSLVTFPRIFQTPESLVAHPHSLDPSNEMGVTDRSIDGRPIC
jgi:hypothetical protein